MRTQPPNGRSGSRIPVIETFTTGELLRVLRAFKKGDFSARLKLDYSGVSGEIAQTLNDVIELTESMARELERINNVVGKEGKLSQRAGLQDARGDWVTCIESVNELIADLVQP